MKNQRILGRLSAACLYVLLVITPLLKAVESTPLPDAEAMGRLTVQVEALRTDAHALDVCVTLQEDRLRAAYRTLRVTDSRKSDALERLTVRAQDACRAHGARLTALTPIRPAIHGFLRRGGAQILLDAAQESSLWALLDDLVDRRPEDGLMVRTMHVFQDGDRTAADITLSYLEYAAPVPSSSRVPIASWLCANLPREPFSDLTLLQQRSAFAAAGPVALPAGGSLLSARTREPARGSSAGPPTVSAQKAVQDAPTPTRVGIAIRAAPTPFAVGSTQKLSASSATGPSPADPHPSPAAIRAMSTDALTALIGTLHQQIALLPSGHPGSLPGMSQAPTVAPGRPEASPTAPAAAPATTQVAKASPAPVMPAGGTVAAPLGPVSLASPQAAGALHLAVLGARPLASCAPLALTAAPAAVTASPCTSAPTETAGAMPQVRLEATIGALDAPRSSGSGVQWRSMSEGVSLDQALYASAPAGSSSRTSGASQGIRVGVIAPGDLPRLMRSLETLSFRPLTSPHRSVACARPARFEFEERLDLAPAGATPAKVDTSAHQEAPRAMRLLLEVVPRVGTDRWVTLDLALRVGPSGGAEAGAPGAATEERHLRTSVRLEEEQTLVLAGLCDRAHRGRESRGALLGRLPLVGRLFKQRASPPRQSDLLVLVTPHIVNTSPATDPRIPND